MKYNLDGGIQRHKGCLVAKGYTQGPRVDFDEVYTPVVRMETMRLLLVSATQRRWHVYHFDVKSAFLNGDILEKVYVEQSLR